MHPLSGEELRALPRMQREEPEGRIHVRGSDQVPAVLSTLKCGGRQSWRPELRHDDAQFGAVLVQPRLVAALASRKYSFRAVWALRARFPSLRVRSSNLLTAQSILIA